MDDSKSYQFYLTQQERLWESLCGRCGACCGVVEGDPCEHLIEESNGHYQCSIYDNRFGIHKTKSGKAFECVPIRDILHKSWPGDNCCGYKKNLKNT